MVRKSKLKSRLKLFVMIILFILGYFNSDVIVDKVSEFSNINISDLKLSDKNYDSSTQDIVYGKEEILNSNLEVVFCPSDECFDFIISSFDRAEDEILCAFYELDDFNLTKKLKEKSDLGLNVELIIDDKYLEEEPLKVFVNSDVKIFSDVKRGTRYNNYMHSKFCVIDNKYLFTGSTNPTQNGLFKNNNNLVGFESVFLAQNYKSEFLQMASNSYGTNKKSTLKYNNVTLDFENESYLISSYMCPQDNCMDKLIDEISSAKSEVLFAAFALTHDDLKLKLIEKANLGLNITGIIEKRNVNLKGSDFKELNVSSVDMFVDKSKGNMHHKFFVIDERIVVTGSMNPSASGANYNDENILIIENERIAKLFKEEFEKLIN